MTEREDIIRNYVAGYNDFDLNKMVQDLDGNIVFENISNGDTNVRLMGLSSFMDQAEQAATVFSERKQTIKSFTHHDDDTEVELDYYAVLAVDLPDGLKAGEELRLQGRSIFTFAGNKIVQLTDIS